VAPDQRVKPLRERGGVLGSRPSMKPGAHSCLDERSAVRVLARGGRPSAS
jgi:hypothetical protein